MTEKVKKMSFRERKAVKKHTQELDRLVRGFFNFLGSKPQPNAAEVRSEFVKSELAWKQYCSRNNLGFRTSMLFNAKVAYEWEQLQVQERKSQ